MSDTDHLSAPPARPTGLQFARVVQAVVTRGGDKLEIAEISPEAASFVMKRAMGPVAVVILRLDAEDPERTRARLEQLIRLHAPHHALDLVLVGGDAGTQRRVLKKARPMMTRNRVGLYHVSNELEAWAHETTVVRKLLHPFEKTIAEVEPDPETWRQLAERSAETQAKVAEQAEELQAFAGIVRQRRPVVTWTIAAVIGAVFGLQLVVGSTSPVALMRLGALSPARVAEGELWRLISCTFLHGGWLHALLNTYVLIILGSFLERIIGPARFLALYALSAVAGSLGSVLFLKASFSVGASGAVWGLLGAHAILAFRPKGLLPAALIPGARRAAMINLGINVLNSFRPYVDMWAHFAGGAAGAALFASGALTRSIPRLGDIEEQQAVAPDASPSIPASRGLRVAAAVSGVILVGGLAVALAVGRPWALMQPVGVARVELEGISIEVPKLPRKVSRTEAFVEHTFGDPLNDPVMAGVRVIPGPDPALVERELATLRRSLVTPDKAKQLAPPRTFKDRGDTGLTVLYRFENGATLERAFLFRPRRLIVIELLRWPDADADFTAETLIKSARAS
jgi:membrane associated rhomboid family serine protease